MTEGEGVSERDGVTGREGGTRRYARPVPTIGDTSSAAQRREDPAGWAMGEDVTEALAAVVAGRRDIRRFRPDPVPDELLTAVLQAGHRAPSVGHSQPWRFVVVTDPATRDRAAAMADRCRAQQAAHLSSERAVRMLDLKLEGLREAPVGVVVACDRRVPAGGVLGRATYPDADLWSCATAVENMWLTARAHGLGMGWVTLFEPDELADLLALPDGVVTLGWLCLGWPDERPPSPGLERAAWSRRAPLEEVVVRERWPADEGEPARPVSHLRGPQPERLVGATDAADELLSPPESLGVLDRALSRVLAVGAGDVVGGTLVLAGADHPVTSLGVSAYPSETTHDVLSATVAGSSLGAATAAGAGLAVVAVDAGVAAPVAGAHDARPAGARGDLATAEAMSAADVADLIDKGREIGRTAGSRGLVCLGEVGVGNTTVAAALACALLDLEPQDAVGLGSGSDAAMVARKREVVASSLARTAGERDPLRLLAALGGPEVALLTGVTLGAAEAGAPVALDRLAGSLPGLVASRLEPAAQAYLLAGHVSRERAHALVLRELGLEPLLALRLRSGEGVGACLAASLVLQGLAVRRVAARTR
ncbi:5,6-dimethylbenzimidazole synthase [Janibacter melonis]|uniref:5,6-dimethylbenzimidazole synthase n=1 Tax=Janibacter melonis TaxID=262209 RepID=UPI002094BEEB|nr:5,6-dimethylbenzimidazole synthase [Janibacter melonis]